jgi:flagellar basal body-associated protein FliL
MDMEEQGQKDSRKSVPVSLIVGLMLLVVIVVIVMMLVFSSPTISTGLFSKVVINL